MKAEKFAVLTTAVELANDAPALRAFWTSECERAGARPVSEPTWEVATSLPVWAELFPEDPRELLRIEGLAEHI